MSVILVLMMTACSSSRSSKCSRLYVGTDDKETNQIEIPLDKQKEILLDIISRYADGATIYEADGYWKNENGEMTFEKTFVCEFFDVDKNVIKNISKDVLLELNQKTILYTEQNQKFELWF